MRKYIKPIAVVVPFDIKPILAGSPTVYNTGTDSGQLSKRHKMLFDDEDIFDVTD